MLRVRSPDDNLRIRPVIMALKGESVLLANVGQTRDDMLAVNAKLDLIYWRRHDDVVETVTDRNARYVGNIRRIHLQEERGLRVCA